MDKKMIKRLLTIASVGLLLSAAIFICLCLFTTENNNTYLGVALGCLILSSLFNIIRNRNNSLTIPILIISVIFVIALFVLLSIILEHLMAPKDYLFFETSMIPTKLMIYAIVILFITVVGVILKKFKINKSENLDIYIDLWKRFKGIGIVLFAVILYCFFTSVTFVTENRIIYRDPLHPFGVSYDYSDVTKIETGFGNKSFSFVDYKRKGQFYYSIYVDNKKITFSVPSINEKIEKYENDSYLELEEFDNRLMKYNIEKITSDEYASACDLDKQYCDRFIRIINNNLDKGVSK